MTTHYETLGITKDATQEEIKKAYRRLAGKHHPDKGGDTATFQNIQTAYDAISTEEKRRQYDNPPSQSPFGDGGLDDFIRQTFGFGFQQQARRNRDVQINLEVTLESLMQDQTHPLQVEHNGTHIAVDVVVPKGATHGSQIRYANLGDHQYKDIPRGDLYVRIFLKKSEKFMVDGIDLYTPIEVNCIDAMIGTQVLVCGVDNKQFSVTIPSGTQHHTKYRIPNQGIPVPNTEQRGHLYVVVNVIVPKLSDDQISSLIKFKDTVWTTQKSK